MPLDPVAAAKLDIQALPKAELHMHFEASLRSSTAQEWSKRYGLPMPRNGPFAGLGEFVGTYEVARDLVGSLDDLRRAATELVVDASRQGVIWSEVHLIPPTYAGRLGPEEGIVEAVLDGFAEGSAFAANSGRSSAAGVIIGINRGLGPDAAQQSLDLALRYADKGVVGLGLAGDEANHPAAKFADVFRQGRNGGLMSLPHGGEAAGPESVRACVQELAASRVCHGVRAVEDPDVVALLIDRDVCLDVCPSSNVSLQVSQSLEQHQLLTLLDAGVRVSLNSDGPLLSGAQINDEYVSAYTSMGLPPLTLAQIALTSLTSSSCPEQIRSTAREQIATWVTERAEVGALTLPQQVD